MGDQADAVRAWREDNPRATFRHEAFGTEWAIPVGMPVWAVLTMQGVADDTGRFDPRQLGIASFIDLARAILGADTFAAWTSPELDLDTDVFALEVGRAYGAKLARSRQGEPAAEPTESDPPTSSDTGTSSTPLSPTSTATESTPT